MGDERGACDEGGGACGRDAASEFVGHGVLRFELQNNEIARNLYGWKIQDKAVLLELFIQCIEGCVVDITQLMC